MAEPPKLEVRPRTVLGKKVGALRREGRLPAVIFGGHADSTPVETDTSTFQKGYRRWGQTTLLSLTGLDGGEVPVLVHDVSREPRTGSLLHVDFARVSLTEKTHAEVPLHFAGESPAVRTHGGVMVHALSEVRIEAFPQDIPHQIEVDLSRIEQIEDTLYVRDLVVDASKIEILNDGDQVVAKAVAPRAEEVVAPVVAAEGEAVEGEVAEGEAAAPAVDGAAPATGAPAAKGAAPAAKGAPAAAKGAPAAEAPKGKKG
ncbi:MAG TPA: 50S ribosomal protein L25 [Candidatus Limnocylindria bacterium]|nr:50S ribosomal protein L25 [Candidatus Limnocylindria bacterium]